jgi:hypothetical protein
MAGLYGVPLVWPSQDDNFDIYIIDHMDDYMMHIDQFKCPRL